MRTSRPSSLAKGSELTRALNGLERAVDRLPRQFEYVIHPGKHLFMSFVRGVVYGLGAITAFAVLIPIIVWVLHRVEWVPIVGDFVNKVATQVEQVRGLQ